MTVKVTSVIEAKAAEDARIPKLIELFCYCIEKIITDNTRTRKVRFDPYLSRVGRWRGWGYTEVEITAAIAQTYAIYTKVGWHGRISRRNVLILER